MFFIDPGPAGLFEIDGIEVGDECVILSPNVHGHFVDHGKLQFATVRLASKARVNDGATIMPFSDIGFSVTLLTQCTTIKGMVLEKSGIYMGNTAAMVKSQGLHDEEALQSTIRDLQGTMNRMKEITADDEHDLRIVLGVCLLYDSKHMYPHVANSTFTFFRCSWAASVRSSSSAETPRGWRKHRSGVWQSDEAQPAR